MSNITASLESLMKGLEAEDGKLPEVEIFLSPPGKSSRRTKVNLLVELPPDTLVRFDSLLCGANEVKMNSTAAEIVNSDVSVGVFVNR